MIIKHGECMTLPGDEYGNVMAVPWSVADTTRPSHGVSHMCGPYDGPGTRDVLFNNKMGVVVPPGTVNAIIAQMQRNGKKPVATYKRKGGLYVTKMKMKAASGFARRGVTA